MEPLYSRDSIAGTLLEAEQVGWFAVRQPAIMRLLANSLSKISDAYVVALDGAWRLASVFELRDGVAPTPLSEIELTNATLCVSRDALSEQALADGAAARQTELCRWIAAYVADPPIALSRPEASSVGNILIAVLYAFDASTQGELATIVPS